MRAWTLKLELLAKLLLCKLNQHHLNNQNWTFQDSCGINRLNKMLSIPYFALRVHLSLSFLYFLYTCSSAHIKIEFKNGTQIADFKVIIFHHGFWIWDVHTSSVSPVFQHNEQLMCNYHEMPWNAPGRGSVTLVTANHLTRALLCLESQL